MMRCLPDGGQGMRGMSAGFLRGVLRSLRPGWNGRSQRTQERYSRSSRGRLGILLACALAVSPLITAGAPAQAARASNLSISVSVTTPSAALPHGGTVGTGWRVIVSAYNLDGTRAGYTDGGPYTISDLDAGSYRIKVSIWNSTGTWAPTWYGNVPREQDGTIIQLTDSPVTGVDIMLDYAGSISGHIASAAANGQAEGLTAAAYLYDPRTEGYEYASLATADAAGDYRITGLSPGSYLVKFSQYAASPVFSPVYYGSSTAGATSTLVTVEADSTTSGIGGVVPVWTNSVTRVAGADRFETSVAASQAGFTPGVPVVYVANGLNWPDALSAGPAAAYLGGPLLLVTPDQLPAVVKTELERLRPQRIVVVGGPVSVSDATFAQISTLAPAVLRVGGADRYATSRAVFLEAFGPKVTSRAVFVVTGQNFPDALSASAAAAQRRAPVLLIDGAQPTLDQPTRDLLWGTIFNPLTLVGGTEAVGAGIAVELEFFTQYNEIDRIGGADRYDTNRLLNRWVFPTGSLEGAAYLATGEGFADALSGGPLAALSSAPIFLTPPQCVPSATLGGLRALNANVVTVLGGVQALGSPVARLTAC